NEHLASGHIEELAKPTYSTCIGLILKGYDDYEHNRKHFNDTHRRVEVPDGLKRAMNGDEVVLVEDEDGLTAEQKEKRKNLKNFWGKFKDGIIDLFKEEEDKHL
ncbi:MAG: cell division protein FtsA, partial [Bacteroidota bacterium]|nr:cell division protein FtsA [Bacteroidota bacterium]